MSKQSDESLGRETRTFPISLGGRLFRDAAQALQAVTPRASDDLVKVLIGRAAKLVGLSYSRAFDIWYRKARRVEQYEIDAIVDRLIANEAKETRNELQELRRRLQCLESRLIQTDADFHREDLHSIGHTLGRSR